MNAPSIQSAIATPQTPLAMLMPDHGTTPIRRRTERRTHADDLVLSRASKPASPSKALRVKSRARGKKCVRNGARGFANSVAKMEPTIVNAVNSRVASAGEKSAPAKTFCMIKIHHLGVHPIYMRHTLTHITLPGIDHACFHTDVIERTPITCAIGPGPL
jgi:hypothetical protein